MIKRQLVRGVRKSAHLTRRVLSVGANYSGKVENKAHRIINGMDATIHLNDKILFEKLYCEALPYITPLHPALPLAGREGRVSLLIPSLQNSSFYGGTATALIFAALIANKSDKNLLVIETLKKGSATKEQLLKFFESNSIVLNHGINLVDISSRRYNHYGYIDLHPDDIFLCSAWWDAHILQDLPLNHRFIYLIQDYEPIFYNNSDLKVLAENTYRSDKFVPVCNTELMLKFMTHKGYKFIMENGLYFEPAVNVGKKVGYRSHGPKKIKKLFVYGRPSVERNLFYSALRALDEAFSEHLLDPNEWECFMAGQSGLSNILLSTGKEVTSLGKLTLENYYNFAKEVDLGISLMLAPHPSYPPLELSSLGAAVVTTAYETKVDLGTYNRNLVVCEPSVDAIKQGIKRAEKIGYKKRMENARATNLPSTWSIALTNTVNSVISRLS